MNLINKLVNALSGKDPGPPRILPAEAADRIARGAAVLIDVREPDEWKEGVAKPAHLLALSDLNGPREKWKPFLQQHGEQELILYCRSGGRSGQAATILSKEGFRVANLGGFSNWVSAKLPVRQP